MKHKENTDSRKVLDHLMAGGSITNLKAFEKWQMTRLGAVVCALRDSGHIIYGKSIKNARRPKKKHHVYYMGNSKKFLIFGPCFDRL